MEASSESHTHGLGGEARQIDQEWENSMKSAVMEETQESKQCLECVQKEVAR